MIPAEAVEAAADKLLEILPNIAGEIPLWATLQALEAAAPHMRAAAWDEGVQAQKAWTWNDDMEPLTNPYRSTRG